jgi:hypothetical protein
MLENARDFFSRVLPWDGEGFVNIHWKSARVGKNGKPFWNGLPATDLHGALRAVDYALRHDDARDIYVCMSRQKEKSQRAGRSGRPFDIAERSQENALALRSLFIDVDVKPGAYESTKAALLAFKAFVAASGLPMASVIVATGSGGFHAHWALDRALPPHDWQPLANALAHCVSEHGLIVDTQCTIDSARILRVPDTWNYKHDDPQAVRLLLSGPEVTVEEMVAVLGNYLAVPEVRNIVAPNIEPRPRVAGLNDELGGGIGHNAPPINIQSVALSCAFVKDALDTGGAAYTNPLWFLTTSIATFTEGGRDDAHAMASGHPGYTVETTDELYQRASTQQAKRDLGWPSCEKISLSGATQCKSCPLLAAKKSPLNHAVGPAVAPANDVSLDVLPDDFFRDQRGVVHKRTLTDDGQVMSIPVCPFPLRDGWLQDDPWTLHFTTEITPGARHKIHFEFAAVMAKDGFGKACGAQGMMLTDLHAKALREFLVAWVTKLRQVKDAIVASTPFGWSTQHGKIDGFTYAGRVWCGDIDRPAATADPLMASTYMPKGDIAPWVTAAQMITDQERPELDAILAAAFAGPLVRFTGQSGCMLSAYSSESGIGKTTTMRVAQAVWADPIKAMQSLNDTPNSVLKKIGDLKALPLFWDELKTEADTQKFVLLSFQLTQGKERSRLNYDITQRNPGTWQTILVSASNDSLVDPVQRVTKSTTAGLYRLFEYAVPPGTKGQIEHGVVSRAVAALNESYGQPGLLYAQFLGREHKRVAREVAEMQDKLAAKLKAGNDERFWIAVMTTVIMGAMYANELGLTRIGIQPLLKHLASVMTGMRETIKETPSDMKSGAAVSTVLAQYLSAMRARHTLVTNRLHVGRGKPAKGSIQVLSDVSKLDAIYVHRGRDDGLMRISSTQFSRWLADHDFPSHALRKALTEDYGMKITNAHIGAGTEYVGGMEYLLELDLNDQRMKGVVDDA